MAVKVIGLDTAKHFRIPSAGARNRVALPKVNVGSLSAAANPSVAAPYTF